MKHSIQKIRTEFPNCCDITSNKVASEKGKRFEIKCSKDYYLKIRVDGCIIDDKTVKKCDYLFIRDYDDEEGKTEFYFVELKGSEIDKAFQQLLSTIKHIKGKVNNLAKDQILGFIVSSKYPKTGTGDTKLRQEFAKNHGKELRIKNKEIIHTPI